MRGVCARFSTPRMGGCARPPLYKGDAPHTSRGSHHSKACCSPSRIGPGRELTALSYDQDVGVKLNVKRFRRPSQGLTFGCLPALLTAPDPQTTDAPC